MSDRSATSRRAPRALTPFIVVVGPLLCALSLTALGYVMFRAQAVADTSGQSTMATLSGPLEYTVILALAGALVSLLMALLGLALYGKARKATEARESALAEGIERLTALDRITRRIAERGERREAAASAWTRRQRGAFAQLSAMGGPRAALQRITGDIWAGVSHPGAPLDAPTALRMARESAVAGAALGAALDDLRSLMASSPAEIDAIEAIDDALVEDLIALEELTRQTRLAIGKATEVRGANQERNLSEVEDGTLTPPLAPLSTGRQPAINSDEWAPEESRSFRRPGDLNPLNPQTGEERPTVKDAGVAWPPPVAGWPVGREGSVPPNAPAAGSSGKWPRQVGDVGEQRGTDSSARWPEPRERDDSNSRWLND